jgi:hypothetical protein
MKLVAASIALLLQVAPVPTPQQVPRASIEGVVRRVGSGDPIGGAQVTVTTSAGAAAPRVPPVLTDRDGNFTINNLDAGSFKVTVLSNGYARQELGQRHPAGSGAPIVLTAGQRLRDVEIRLTPAGNVSGHIRDSRGRPTPGITLRLLQLNYTENGRRTLESVATAHSDDRGAYRFYWVRPGRYYVVAGGREGGNTNEFVLPHANTFFPGSTEIEKAIAVDLRSGGEVDGVDFTVVSTKSYRIRAHVVDPATGKSPSKALGGLSYWTPGGGTGVFGPGFYKAETGTVELEGVTPGIYEVGVTAFEDSYFSLPALTAGPSASARASVTNADVDLGVLTLEARHINGHLTSDLPLEAPSRNAIKISLWGPEPSRDVGEIYSPLGASLLDDLTFTGHSPYSSLRVTATGLPPGTYLREAWLDGKDALNDFARVSSSSKLELVLSSKAGQVEGIVRDERAIAVPGVQVVLVPDSARSRPQLFKATISDQNGHFLLSGVAPGDYKAFAWDGLEPYSYFDAAVRRKYEPKGRPVHIEESSRETVDLMAIFATTD